MSRIECPHVLYCDRCDRYHCAACGCACERGTKPALRGDDELAALVDLEDWVRGWILPGDTVAVELLKKVDAARTGNGKRRAYLIALEDVAKAARGHSPSALVAAMDALDRATAAESAVDENKGAT